MKLDLTNMQFGLLTAREMVGKSKRGNLWRCDCACGNEKIVPAALLRNGHTQSCGCIQAQRKAGLDITGQRWGRLVAVRLVGYMDGGTEGAKRQAVWLWQCDCGNTKEIPATQVKHGGTRSCGCLAREHAVSMRVEDITGQTFGRLTAIRPTRERTPSGSVIWELSCECGERVYKTVNALKTGRVLSCGCLYRETRRESFKARRDLVKNTSLSTIVAGKKPMVTNTSGSTGVWYNPKTGRYEAYINYQKKRYYLGTYRDIREAIHARKQAEQRLHDPVVCEYFQNLTPAKKKEFLAYLQSGTPENQTDGDVTEET